MRALFLSYDGLTDNLGASQVIPYLRGLARAGHEITVLSCEKPARAARMAATRALLEGEGIRWEWIPYHKRPPVLSTLFDLAALARRAEKLCRDHGIEAVHCRSYVPALAGARLQRRLGVKLIFDMRGFWADERVDGGLWNLANPLFAWIYRWFKRRESELLASADASVCLTEAGRRELLTWPVYREGLAEERRLSVVPCCADTLHFDPASVPASRSEHWRERLSLGGAPVFVYLGSLGTWYLLDPVLELFREALRAHPRATLVFLTPEEPEAVLERARALGVPVESLRVLEASRGEVPEVLSVCDIGVFFIRPAYSKKSSSATKLAELLAMGIPVITNAGVGDHAEILSDPALGCLLHDLEPASLLRAAREVPRIAALDRAAIRHFARENFSLERGTERYLEIYARLESREPVRYV